MGRAEASGDANAASCRADAAFGQVALGHAFAVYGKVAFGQAGAAFGQVACGHADGRSWLCRSSCMPSLQLLNPILPYAA